MALKMPGRPTVDIREPPFGPKDLAAARLLDTAIDPEELPVYVPGEPWGLAALEVATAIAPALMDALAELYGLDTWDAETFRDHYLGGALAAWRAGLHIEDTGDEIHIGGVACPLLSAASRDPRACHMCQLMHQAAARYAMGGQVDDLRFDALVTHGDATCEATLALRDR